MNARTFSNSKRMDQPDEDGTTRCSPGVAATASTEHLDDRILVIRGRRVLLDADLAVLYGVSTSRLNEQVKRNRERFPEDFMLQLTLGEARALRESRSQSQAVSQFAVFVLPCKPSPVIP